MLEFMLMTHHGILILKGDIFDIGIPKSQYALSFFGGELDN